MLNSDSDEEIFLMDELYRLEYGSSDEEPPRRRMRMDLPVTHTTTPVLMTLRSGRALQVPLFDVDDSDNEIRSQASGDQEMPASRRDHPVHYTSSSNSSSQSPDGAIRVNLDFDEEESIGSYEPYDTDMLSDVVAIRSSPASLFSLLSESESSDGESMFGNSYDNATNGNVENDNDINGNVENDNDINGNLADDNDINGNVENDNDTNGNVTNYNDTNNNDTNDNNTNENATQGSDNDEEDETQNIVWEHRRLERRNAIVLENSDSSDIEVVGHQDEPRGDDVPSDLAAPTKLPEPNLDAAKQDVNLATNCDDDDNDNSTCLICYETYTNSGNHRLCCLKCGHTYGKKCIVKWIKSEARCPQCNAKACMKDVRVLYVKKLIALDTTEKDRILAELEQEQMMKRKLELECTRLRQLANEADMKYKSLSEQFRCLKERVGTVYMEPGFNSVQPSTSTHTNYTNEKGKFVLVNSFPFKDEECRVGAYDEWLNMLAVSQTVKTTLYPQGCYGIRRINLLSMKSSAVTPLHLKEIRDMEFSNSQGEVLLSVGFDKRAILTNCTSNVTVQCFTADYPLWSCTWSKAGQYVFYAGTANGQILAFDVRMPGLVFKTLVLPSEDKTPVARVKFITPTSGNNSFNMSGLLVQKLNSCWFCELRNDEVRYHQLPVEGPLLSVDFEPRSRHALISTRPRTKVPSRHIVCDLMEYHSEAQQRNICASNTVQTYQGNEFQLGKLTRSAIFSSDVKNVYVAAEVGGIKNAQTSIWNVSDVKPHQIIPNIDPVLDYVPCRVNNNFLLGMISSKNLNIYKQLI